jgi:hypothetical protein
MDGPESEDTAAECILPLPSSYAGVSLGLSAASAPEPQSTRNVIIRPANSNCDHRDMQPTQALSPPANSSFTTISSPIILTVPQRCSHRSAAKAEQAGGRLVYSHTDAPRVILR